MTHWIQRRARTARRDAFKRAIVSVLLLPIASVIAFSGISEAGASVSTSAAAATPVTFDGPIAVVANKSDAWIANIEGDSVTEVSASDGSLVQTITGPSYKFDSPVAMAISGADVWVANEGTEYFGGTQPGSVTEFSASTGQLVRVVKGAAFNFTEPVALSTNGTDVWVADNDNVGSDSVTEFAASTGSLVRVISAAKYDFQEPQDVIVSGQDVWVSDFESNSVTEINASTGKLVQVLSGASSDFDGPVGLAAKGDNLWISSTYEGNFGGVTEVNETSGAPENVLTSTPSTSYEFFGPTSIALKKPDAWVVNVGNGFGDVVTEFSIATGDLVRVISGSQYEFNDVPGGVGTVATNGTDVWVVTDNNETVTEFSAATGALIKVIGS